MPGKKKVDGEKKKGDKIVVSKAGLEKMLAQMEQVTKDNEAMRQRIERVEAGSDAGRMDAFDNKKRVIGPRQYTLSTYDGKVITGWRTMKDKAWKDPTSNRMRHEQTYEILFEDSTKMEVAGYDNFANIHYEAQIKTEEIERKVEGANVTLHLKVIEQDSEKFGEEYWIDLAFVN